MPDETLSKKKRLHLLYEQMVLVERLNAIINELRQALESQEATSAKTIVRLNTTIGGLKKPTRTVGQAWPELAKQLPAIVEGQPRPAFPLPPVMTIFMF